MKNSLYFIRTILFGSLLILLSACSDVEFSPATVDPETNEPVVSNKPATESFTQGEVVNKLDVLVVVDNSASMAEEQQKMGEKIDSFLSTLHDVDWQIGITTTDVSDGKYGLKGTLLDINGGQGYILNKDTPNYNQLFKNTVVRPESFNCGTECASGEEQPIRAAMMAISKKDDENAGFFRPNADLGLLILTDEDEKSNGNSTATQPAELIQHLRSAWPTSKNLYAYGMIIRPSDVDCMSKQSGAGNYGTLIEALARLTGGLTGSICDNNFGPTLGRLARDVRKLLNYVQIEFFPKKDSVKVSFIPAHTTNWSVEGRRIYFQNPPPKDTKIIIDYIVK